MTKTEAITLIQGEILTQWGSTTPIAWDNEPFNEDELNVPWIKVHLAHFDGDQVTLGNPLTARFRNQINIWVIVNTLAGVKGVAPNNTLAEQAEQMFKGKHFVLGQEAMWLRNVGTRTVGGIGKWYKQRVFARASFDTIG